MNRAVALVVIAGAVACSTPQPVSPLALRARNAANAVALQMALTDACLGFCEQGFTCDEETGKCVEAPCGGTCAEGFHCEGEGLDAACVPADGEEIVAESAVATRLEHVFDPKPGFGGGDGVYSIDLGDGRTLWLLNDTWVGPVTDGKRGPGATIVHNAIALWSHEDGEPGAPAPELSLFHKPATTVRRGVKTEPDAWILPEAVPDAPPIDDWYWWADGLVLPESGQLAMFVWHIQRRPSAEGGTWDFARNGGALAVVDHPGEPPTTWQPRITQLPFSAGPGEVAWGADVVVDPDEAEGVHLLVFGTRTLVDPPSRDLLVARVPAAEIEHTDAWKFWSGAEWSNDATKAAAIASDVTDELSVHIVDEEGGVENWILVHADPSLGTELFARVGAAAIGPFSAPHALGELEPARGDGYFTYGAKGHDHLSPAGDLVVSYVVNHEDIGTMAADLNIYRPRFQQIPLEAMLGGEPVEPAP